MATQAAAGRGEHHIGVPSTRAELRPEKGLNRFLRFVGFGEWAGNALGALAFMWATAVLLGGFGDSLNRKDFWFATAIIFIEAFRLFSRKYSFDDQSLFGTTRALGMISSSFVRMLGRHKEGDEVVLLMTFCSNVVERLALSILRVTIFQTFWRSVTIFEILRVSVLILMSKLLLLWTPKLIHGSQRYRRLLLWGILIAFLLPFALTLTKMVQSILKKEGAFIYPCIDLVYMLIQIVAVFLLDLRPQKIIDLTNSHCGRKLLFLAKVMLAIWFPLTYVPPFYEPLMFILVKPLSIVVLTLGSLQTSTNKHIGRRIDTIFHIIFLGNLVGQFSGFGVLSLLFLPVLLIENLQIPASIAQIVLSSLRLGSLYYDYNLQGDKNPNMVPSIAVFYVLALCQGALYTMACVLALFSFIPRRSLVRQSNFSGKQGVKAINVYYENAYTKRMERGVLDSGETISLENFAIVSLSSSSCEEQMAGVCVLDNLLHQREPSEDLLPRLANSGNALSTLIGMLGWTGVQDRDRLFAARITAKLAGNIRISEFPVILGSISFLLDMKNSGYGGNEVSQPADIQQAHGQTSSGSCSWVHQRLQQIKEKNSIPKEASLTDQDLFPVQGMIILEKLACDLGNCAEIVRASSLISKIVGSLSYNADNESSNDKQNHAVILSSLKLLRRLATTGEKIGVEIRQELWTNNFLLDNLANILEDESSSSEVLELVTDIIAKLVLNEGAGHEIGRIKVIIARLLHAFLGRDGSTSMYYYKSSVRMTAGDALANITTWSTADCLAILAEPGYEVIQDLKNLLSDHSYITVASTLLQNICAHCRDELRHGASEHLSSALSVAMENILSANGKQLESLIGLASQIYDVLPATFSSKLRAHTNPAVLVQKLVRTLNSNKKPNPDYPRMRRVTIEMAISIVKSCPRYASIFKEEGVMEALTMVERTPSKVEEYRLVYGNVGVVLESGTSLPVLAAKAKRLIDSAAPTPGVQQSNHA